MMTPLQDVEHSFQSLEVSKLQLRVVHIYTVKTSRHLVWILPCRFPCARGAMTQVDEIFDW